MPESTYTVRGMSCGHCTAAVTEEVGRIEGVREVRVELATGRVTVTADRPVAEEEMRAAVTEAGYQLTVPFGQR